MKNLVLIISIAAIPLFFSCKKKEVTPSTSSVAAEPTISVSTLSVGDTIQSGATLQISGTISSTLEMHGYKITVHNLATSTEVFTYELHSDEKDFSFNQQWVNNVSDTSAMELSVIAAKDHDGNTFTKTIQFVCLP